MLLEFIICSFELKTATHAQAALSVCAGVVDITAPVHQEKLRLRLSTASAAITVTCGEIKTRAVSGRHESEGVHTGAPI